LARDAYSEIVDDDRRTLRGECACYFTTDPASAASNRRNLTLKMTCHPLISFDGTLRHLSVELFDFGYIAEARTG
jgi:hypothetical protein